MQRRRILAIILTLTISGCGFQLRGSFNLPPNLKALTVEGHDPYSTLLVQTRELLNAAGVATPDDAPYTLFVTSEELGKTRFTQNQNVLLDEFMLSHKAEIELRRRDGSLVLEPQELTELTLFQDDQSTAGTKLNEENILRAELAQKLAVKILRRIQAVKQSQWEADPDTAKATVVTDTLGNDAARGESSDSASQPGDNSPDNGSLDNNKAPAPEKNDASAP